MTNRELQVLELTARGLTSKEVAHNLDICDSTVNTYIKRIKEKTGIHSIKHIIHLATKEGII